MSNDTTPRDMMTTSPAAVLARDLRAYLAGANAGAWYVGESGWDGAVQLVHPFRPQARVYSVDDAQSHIAKHA